MVGVLDLMSEDPELNVYQSLSGVPTSGSKAGPWMSWYERYACMDTAKR